MILPSEPDLDFDKYAVKLAELDKDSLLAHILYWRKRCLLVEQAARLATDQWDCGAIDGDENGYALLIRMQALAALVNED